MKFTSVFILFFTVSIYATNAQTSSGIKFFEGSWAEVLAEAKKQNKPVFVDAYTTWCGPCKWMAKNVFTLESVAEFFNTNFVNYKFNMETGEGPAFARKYAVRAYPTLLFLEPNEKVIHRTMGAKDEGRLLGTAQLALDMRKQ